MLIKLLYPGVGGKVGIVGQLGMRGINLDRAVQ